MKALIILACISAVLFFIANIWVKIVVSYNDQLTLRLKILFFSFTLFPQKKKKINPKKFTVKKFRKRRIKEEKAYLKKISKRKSKPKSDSKTDDTALEKAKPKKGLKRTAEDAVAFIRDVVIKILKKTGKYLRTDISEFRITVGGDDAAAVAIEYGVVSQIVGYTIALVDNLKHTRYTKNATVEISCDFAAPSSDVKAHLGFRLRVWHIIAIAVSGITGYIKSGSGM